MIRSKNCIIRCIGWDENTADGMRTLPIIIAYAGLNGGMKESLGCVIFSIARMKDFTMS